MGEKEDGEGGEGRFPPGNKVTVIKVIFNVYTPCPKKKQSFLWRVILEKREISLQKTPGNLSLHLIFFSVGSHALS